MRKLEADVLIIGSGPGGAMTAAVLAEAGKHVMIIEEGDHVPVGATEPYSLEDMALKWRNGGLTPAFGPVQKSLIASVKRRWMPRLIRPSRVANMTMSLCCH